MSDPVSRRRFLTVAAAAPVAISAGLAVFQTRAYAEGTAGELHELPLDDPRVAALGYVRDATTAKSDPMYKPGSTCANCSQLKGKVGDKLRPCALFPDLKNPKQLLLVPVNGWCRSWTAIAKT